MKITFKQFCESKKPILPIDKKNFTKTNPLFDAVDDITIKNADKKIKMHFENPSLYFSLNFASFEAKTQRFYISLVSNRIKGRYTKTILVIDTPSVDLKEIEKAIRKMEFWFDDKLQLVKMKLPSGFKLNKELTVGPDEDLFAEVDPVVKSIQDAGKEWEKNHPNSHRSFWS